MKTKDPRTQYAHILYRNGQYKKWQPCKITLPPDLPFEKLNTHIREDLERQGIEHTEIQIKKLTNYE